MRGLQRAENFVRYTVLERLRRRGREVAWTPEFMGVGNLLFMWQWAYEGQADGIDRRCLATENTMHWLPVFPDVRDRLVLLRDEVRFFDQRVRPWRGGGGDEVNRPAVRYKPPLLEQYCREMLLPGVGAEPGPADRLVVNVRRGDYYTPENIDEWGFDVSTFVRAAVDASVSDSGVPGSIHVVSDDTGWCDKNLGFLRDIAPISFGARSDPLSDLRDIAQARRVILANSTFSFWGGYIGDVIPGDRQVIAPAFWRRGEAGSQRHLRPAWTVVDAGA